MHVDKKKDSVVIAVGVVQFWFSDRLPVASCFLLVFFCLLHKRKLEGPSEVLAHHEMWIGDCDKAEP